MSPPKARFPFTIACLLCMTLVSSCVYKYGTSPDTLAAPHGGTHWNHAMNGDDWDGVDATGKPWTCKQGRLQSPINVPHVVGDALPTNFRTIWDYPSIVSNGSNVELVNNGHTIQVEWLYDYKGQAKIAAPARKTNDTVVTAVLGMKNGDPVSYVTAKPVQFHFHTTSEHLLGGAYFPLELHIVHKVTDLPGCAAGCLSVTGVLFQLSNGDDNPLLDAIWANMPTREGEIKYLPAGAEIPLGDLLPKPVDREYVTYEGSLTTPPCTEGLLWHVMTKPQKISYKQWRKYKTAIGDKECALKNETTTAKTAHSLHRHLLAEVKAAGEEAAGNPEDYVCKVVAYGSNFRAAQLGHLRTIKLAQV